MRQIILRERFAFDLRLSRPVVYRLFPVGFIIASACNSKILTAKEYRLGGNESSSLAFRSRRN